MQAMERANSAKKNRQANDPLLSSEPGGSSSDTNEGENRKVNRITVDIEPSNKEEETEQPLIMDSIV